MFFFVLTSVLTHSLGRIKPISAVGTAGQSSSSTSETASSSQPLWSYQVKPNSYLNVPNNQQVNGANAGPGHYSSPFPSIFDAFNGLSQRQGALSSSPFLSILPIILIAAGGMLLLLPFLTMMIASPFSGAGFGGGGGFNGGFGYPQAAGLNKKRSLSNNADQLSQRGLIDLMEHVTSTIEELARKYSGSTGVNNSPLTNGNRRAKALSLQQPSNESGAQQTNNHKSTGAAASSSTVTGSEEATAQIGNNLAA